MSADWDPPFSVLVEPAGRGDPASEVLSAWGAPRDGGGHGPSAAALLLAAMELRPALPRLERDSFSAVGEGVPAQPPPAGLAGPQPRVLLDVGAGVGFASLAALARGHAVRATMPCHSTAPTAGSGLCAAVLLARLNAGQA